MNITQFLSSSYTPYHTVDNVITMLKESGFEQWTLGSGVIRGGRYYTTNGGRSIIAFVVGDKTHRLTMAMSHTDSPCFGIKGNAIVRGSELCRANVEMYGGALCYSFMDRPLRIAGRLLMQGEHGILSRTVCSGYNVTIPSLAIHHNRQANSQLALNIQVDMLPILGECQDIYSTLTTDKVVDADLYLVPSDLPYFSGVDSQYLCSPRIDNLTSVYSSIMALCTSNPHSIAVCACFDSEEIGNTTRQGAKSRWLDSVLASIANQCGHDTVEYYNMLHHGYALSIDNAHAVHPAHPEKYDITERCSMGGGVVVKHHANYATDGLASSILKQCLSDRGIPTQNYYNRSDIPSGSTLGTTVATQLDITVCDIGIAQLAMHSASEMVLASDIDMMTDAVRAVYDSDITVCEDGATI